MIDIRFIMVVFGSVRQLFLSQPWPSSAAMQISSAITSFDHRRYNIPQQSVTLVGEDTTCIIHHYPLSTAIQLSLVSDNLDWQR